MNGCRHLTAGWCLECHGTLNAPTPEGVRRFFTPPAPDGAARIAAEREVQRAKWGDEHDMAEHPNGEMLKAALALILAAQPTDPGASAWAGPQRVPAWIGDLEWKLRRRGDRLHTLAVAGAFVAAEMDRLERLEREKKALGGSP